MYVRKEVEGVVFRMVTEMEIPGQRSAGRLRTLRATVQKDKKALEIWQGKISTGSCNTE